MLKRDDFTLRILGESDVKQVLEWRNSKRIRANMYNDHIITIDEHNAWFERVKHDDCTRYLIFEFRGRPIGVINVVQIDVRNNKCYWGFYLGESDVPRGSGAAMEFLALEYIFEQLNIRKLYCEVIAFNEGVIKMHKKFGFIEEGRFVRHILKESVYVDVISLALFKDVWAGVKQELEQKCFRD